MNMIKQNYSFKDHLEYMATLLILSLDLENCVRDESCREKLAPISTTGPKFVAQTDFCVHR